MPRASLELASIFARFGAAYRQSHSLPREHLRTLRAIELCRTAALGGHVEQCCQCSFTRIAYNSCRNRHCPKCQSLDRAEWVAARQADLLPVEYFHVVFTIPAAAAEVALQNPAAVYNLLFQTTAETLLTIARDPKHLGAEIGFFALLHTWGQNLLHHPHLHCVVPGGGLAPDGTWVSCRPGFFLPVRVLSRLFQRLFTKGLNKLYQKQELGFHGTLAHLAAPQRWARLLTKLGAKPWVVYAKPPLGGPGQVLEYLGRYSHRVAISNQRLLSMDETSVTFQWKDYRQPGRSKRMQLTGEEFIRRFLLHILPLRFQRIRHYGLLSNRRRKGALAECRRQLGAGVTDLLPSLEECQAVVERVRTESLHRCPACRTGLLLVVEMVSPHRYGERGERVEPVGVNSS
jgi:hypothetical protein